jgi:hypothetical protein
MADIISTLFGITPQQAKDQRLERDLGLGGLFAAATMNPYATPSVQNAYMKQQQAQFGLGSMAARGAAGLFGFQDPEVKKASDIESILTQTQEELGPEGLSDPEILNTTLAKKLTEAGYGKEASMLMLQTAPQIQQTKLAKAKAAQENLAFKQEQDLRTALAKLPASASDEQYLDIVKRYAPAKDVMTALERKETAKQAREAKLEETRIRLQEQEKQLQMRLEDQRLAREDRAALQRQLAQMQIDGRREIAQLNAEIKRSQVSSKLTPAQSAVDRKFGTEYADYVALGGSSVINKQLETIDNVIKMIDDGLSVSGPSIALAARGGDEILATIAPDALSARDQIGGVIQSSLREILGGQFAMKEGEQLLARGYNIAESPKKNKERLVQLRKQIAEAAKAKEDSIRYFEEYGTLQDFKSTPALAPKDKEALDWANKNPDDPRAVEIKKRLGQ